MTHHPSNSINSILDSARLIVCSGPGGVGKTTTAATLALTAALRGRRSIVLTIDPAKRLATSLGLQSLNNQPQQIDLSALQPATDKPIGNLWAMMLDQQQTMDDLVHKFAPDPSTLKRTKSNNIYRLMSSTLSGMQEYMALDKLYDLYTSNLYDLVVLDTPPTKNALEFLNTPKRATTFFDERILKWFLPDRNPSNPTLIKRLIRVDPGTVILKLLKKIFGDSFVNDLIDFFDTLYFLQDALKHRGDMIDFILRNESSKFILITSPDPRRIQEALFFQSKLHELGQFADSIILNRVLNQFQTSDIQDVAPSDLPSLLPDLTLSDQQLNSFLTSLKHHYTKLASLSVETRSIIQTLVDKQQNSQIVIIPMFGQDIHSISSLHTLSSYLTQN